MFGIVLWSNPQKRKAVVWCSDHGDLAYVESRDCMSGAGDLPLAGTSCVIEFHHKNGRRVCNKLVPMDGHPLHDLPDILKDMAETDAGATSGGSPLARTQRKSAHPASLSRRTDTRSMPMRAANCDKEIIPKIG